MSRRRRAATAVLVPLLCAGAVLTLPAATAVAAHDAAVVRDRCLTGQWRMGPEASTRLLRELVPIPGWLVTDGTITTTFRNGRMTYGSTLFILEGSIGDGQSVKAEASWINESAYRTRPGRSSPDRSPARSRTAR